MQHNSTLRHIISVLISLFFLVQPSNGQKKFNLSTSRELTILGASSAIIFSSFLINDKSNIEPQEITNLNKSQINFFDRSAVNFYSKDLSLLSDVFVISTVSLPLSLLLIDDAKTDLQSIGIMYLETLALTYGITNLTKNLTQRYRPYAYRSDVSLSEKLSLDTKKSFFSGHTSVAFASAVFFSTVYSEISSNESSKTLVWVGSLTLASTVGLLRYFSGKHFPTDIIAGAVVGSLVGYGIPKIHQSKDNLSFSAPAGSNSISIRYYIK